MDLRTLLFAGVSGLSGTAIYWAFACIPSWKAWLDSLSSEWKRLFVICVSMTIGVICFMATVGMEYTPAPVTSREWIETIAGVLIKIAGTSLSTFGVATIWHTRELAK